MSNINNVIKLDKYTNTLKSPRLLLMKRDGSVIGKISKYTNWYISHVGVGVDEISFDVYKYANNVKCPIWDDLIDLKIVDVEDFGRFEISVDYADSTETIKSIHGVSLESELGQLYLREFHVNDETAATAVVDNNPDFDENGNFISTVLYNEDDPRHSLLHRVLADKAPHWSIGHVDTFVQIEEDGDYERVDEFKRTYTVDGTSIYDFLTGDVSKEANVIFDFDTVNRKINMYNAFQYGSDTTILVSKRKLANEINVSSDKDSVKNCFRIEGGDEVITNLVRAVNLTGSNYIYQFADFQYNDMPEELVQKLKEYQKTVEDSRDDYYGEDGIYTNLCESYERLNYLQSEMMPQVVITDTTAEEQYNIIRNAFMGDEQLHVSVSNLNNYNNNLFVGVTNNIEAMAQVLVDTRFTVEVVNDPAPTYAYDIGDTEGIWTGYLQVKRPTDETDYYPRVFNSPLVITVDADEELYARQKLEKALAKGSMLDIDMTVEEMTDEEMEEYFQLYSLNRLKSFLDGYESCLSILTNLATTTGSAVRDEMYDIYKKRRDIVKEVYDFRQSEINAINSQISKYEMEQAEFTAQLNLQTYLGEKLYNIMCSYVREDAYQNSNYISDGLSFAECMEKAKELLDVATAEIKKACVLQRTVTVPLNNLLALPEFEPLYDSFQLFNYIRVRTEDEILKMRIMQIDFNGDSPADIDVTFSDQIETVDGKVSDVQSILQQAQSIATSYTATTLQAKSGEKANEEISDMVQNGLDTSKMMLKNSDNNEITIDASGILCRRMDDEGYWGDKQLRIIGNGIYMTETDWQAINDQPALSMALGEVYYEGIDGEDGEWKYGVIADVIIGNLIAGKYLQVGDANGNTFIDSDGVKVTGGYVYVVDGNSSILLNPHADSVSYVDEYGYTHTSSQDDMLEIVSDGNRVLYVDKEGSLTTTGTVYSSKGKIGALSVDMINEDEPDEYNVLYFGDYDPNAKTYQDPPMQYDDINDVYYLDNVTYAIEHHTSGGGDIELVTGRRLDYNINEGAFVFNDFSPIEYNTIETYYIIGDTKYEDTITTFPSNMTMPLYVDEINPYINYNGVKYYLQRAYREFTFSNISYIFKANTQTPAEYFIELYISSNNNNTSNNGSSNGLSPNHITYIRPDGNWGYDYIFDILEVPKISHQSKLFLITDTDVYLSDYLHYNMDDDKLTINNIASDFTPRYDSVYNIGSSTLRWKNIYASTGTIQTSDRNKKYDISYDMDKYVELFDRLKPCSFKYKNGTSGRIHTGYIAQDVEEAMEELGITDVEFAGLCKDIVNGVEIYSLRYDEFQAIHSAKIKQLEDKVTDLETRLAQIEQKLKEE